MQMVILYLYGKKRVDSLHDHDMYVYEHSEFSLNSMIQNLIPHFSKYMKFVWKVVFPDLFAWAKLLNLFKLDISIQKLQLVVYATVWYIKLCITHKFNIRIDWKIRRMSWFFFTFSKIPPKSKKYWVLFPIIVQNAPNSRRLYTLYYPKFSICQKIRLGLCGHTNNWFKPYDEWVSKSEMNSKQRNVYTEWQYDDHDVSMDIENCVFGCLDVSKRLIQQNPSMHHCISANCFNGADFNTDYCAHKDHSLFRDFIIVTSQVFNW